MALSLGFGILFATVNTLALFPCLYLIVEKTGICKASGRQAVHHHTCDRTADRKRERNFRRHSMNLHSCFPAWKNVKVCFSLRMNTQYLD
jgi:hypothetical protein